MITIRKLATLPVATRRRKIVRLLESFVRDQRWPARSYLDGLAAVLEADAELPQSVREAAAALRSKEQADTRRAANHLRHLLMRHLGITPGDWDLIPPAGVEGRPAAVERPLVNVALYLESIRSPFNLGSIVRTAAAFGITRVGISEDSPSLEHPRARRSAMGAADLVQVRRAPLDEFARSSGAPCLALELGGRSCFEYPYPRRGILMLGSEELGLSPQALALAEDTISIPMPGPKASLNVGVACGIALAAWQNSLVTGPPDPGAP